jgi:hypothetical protein
LRCRRLARMKRLCGCDSTFGKALDKSMKSQLDVNRYLRLHRVRKRMRRRDPLQTFGLASGSFASADSAKSSLDGTLNHRLRRTEFRPSVDDADKYGADAVSCNVMTIGRMYGEGLQRFLRKNDVPPLWRRRHRSSSNASRATGAQGDVAPRAQGVRVVPQRRYRLP